MNLIEVWGRQATHWTRSSMQWLDRWRDHADARLDAVAGVSLRRWLASIAIATVAACAAAVAVHLLLLGALRSGPGLGWFAVAMVAAIAVVLLVTVVRDTILSYVTPQRRRAHLVALLLSAAALLASVQACAAARVASAGRTVSLWQAEQLYAWHLLDSVPLLAIPDRLEWTRPVVAAGAADRAVLLAFLVALVVPLIRIVLAMYHLTGGRGVQRSSGPVRAQRGRRSLTLPLVHVRLPRPGVAVPLIAAGGFVWGGLGITQPGGRIAATSGLAFAVAALGVIVVAALLWIAMSVLKALWEPLSDGPWMQLALAAGLVWIDNPVRQALLSGVNGFGVAGKIVVTLGLWAVLTVLLLPVWVDPELPESLLALGLLLGFVSVDAPGGERLMTAIGWAPGGFALGRAFATAAACLTATFLVYLLSRAPARAANASRVHLAGSADLRRDLGGYAYVGLQVVIAAAGALMLLYSLGAVGTTSASPPVDAPRSLLSVVWHVVDSIPGPDIPAIAGWHLAADFTGPWAGTVAILTVVALIVVVAFPITRATLRWAKLKAEPSAPDQPLAEVPDALLVDLEFVRVFLADAGRIEDRAAASTPGGAVPPGEREELLARAHEAEERLAIAELNRGKLRGLLGDESPVYWAADHAVSQTADAYRSVVRTQLGRQSLRWSPWPARGASQADVGAAIDLYAAAVERWQMGADVVAELESRVHDLGTRDHAMQMRERDAAAREFALAVRERGINAREQVIERREGDARVREENAVALEYQARLRDQTADARDHDAQVRERQLGVREQTVTTRESQAETRERSLETREQTAETRERGIQAREQDTMTREHRATVRDRELDARQEWMEVREQNTEVREQNVVARERNVAVREQQIEAREQQIEASAQQATAELAELEAKPLPASGTSDT